MSQEKITPSGRTALPFTKMHGCGNDYIYVNCFDMTIDSPEQLSRLLSDRHTGIGGDGLVLILPSDTADAGMRMFNADGSEAGMCGNAIRCVGKYLYDKNIVSKQHMLISTKSGIKELFLTPGEDGMIAFVKVNMGKAALRPEAIPVSLPGERVVASLVTVGGAEYAITCVSVGNPHAVIFCSDVEAIDLAAVGPSIENDPLFPEQVNVEIVEVTEGSRLKMRVWERGSGETQACGTGACASAVAAVLCGYCSPGEDIAVSLLGGELTINYTQEAVFMTGPCVKVFEGVIEV